MVKWKKNKNVAGWQLAFDHAAYKLLLSGTVQSVKWNSVNATDNTDTFLNILKYF